RGDEARRVGSDAEVAGACERNPGSGGDAVDGGDHRLLQRANGEDVRVIALTQPRADVARGLPELGQILADTESPPRPREDHSTDIRLARLLERGRETAMQLRVEGVEDVGPVERDRQDGAVPACLDLG